jgi:hypothetical protein
VNIISSTPAHKAASRSLPSGARSRDPFGPQ